MVADRYWPDDFCARPDIDMAANRRATLPVCTNCHLLKEQAIRTNPAVGMNNDAVWMRNYKTTADLAIKRNVGAGYRGPEAMAQNC